MPIQAPQWTEFLSCPVCCNEFDPTLRSPISLGCGHTVCKTCLSNLHRKQCPFDQTSINTDIENLPINFALLQLVGASVPESEGNGNIKHLTKEDLKNYLQAKKCIEELALYLKPFSSGNGSGGTSVLSRPMQRKLVTLINCQLMEEEGRSRAMRAARSLGERTVTELILQHQNPQQLSANLWAAVRARGCQFLGPAMQEEVLKLVLLALEDGSALSRKVLVMFVVQRLEPHFPQASKTSIGHVSKREGDSSLMQLKEEFRTYEALRREHDAQIVQIATEAGLRIAPDQWSALLYGDTAHKKSSPPTWCECCGALEAVRIVVTGLVEFIQHHGSRKLQEPGHPHNTKYKISMCRDLTLKGSCPRGTNCTFAHSEDELEKYRAKNRKAISRNNTGINKSQELGNKDGQSGEFHNTDKVYVQADDMLYSTTTPTITPAPYDNSVLREGMEYGSYTTPYPPNAAGQPTSIYQPSQQQMFAPTPGTFTPDIYRQVTSEPFFLPYLQHQVTRFKFSKFLDAAPHNMLLSSGGQIYATPSQPDYGSSAPPTEHRPMESSRTGNTWEHNNASSQQSWLLTHAAGTSATKRVASKSLAALQQRKQEIISQLEKVVGKSAASAISSSASSQARVTPVFPSTDNQANTSTYSIWTSGGILHTGRGGNSQVSHIAAAGHPTLYRSDSILADDEFIPFDPPIVSKYGPISRMSKTILRPNSSVQVSASFGDGTISTPMVRRPVPAASPVASPVATWYFNAAQGYPATALAGGRHIIAPPSAGLGDGYITIGHGILDPHFLQSKSVECSKELSKFCITYIQMILRTYYKTLATQGQGATLNEHLSEGEKLTQELQLIEQGIREKEKELRLNQLVSASLASPAMTAVGWNKDGSVNWNVKSNGEYRSDDEDTYEAGIANDMRELEMRLEFELEEQEKRWSSEEESGKK
ncbi:hypothetical protein C0J52_11651 [Blattella germanica]|nr:hypothetical protein C0J52_11651 [Blattella germanica]